MYTILMEIELTVSDEKLCSFLFCFILLLFFFNTSFLSFQHTNSLNLERITHAKCPLRCPWARSRLQLIAEARGDPPAAPEHSQVVSELRPGEVPVGNIFPDNQKIEQ